MPPLASLLHPRLRPTAQARRFALWLASFALLVGVLVPTLSRLALPGSAEDQGALCQARAAGTADSHGAHEPGDACALCTLAHTTPVIGGNPTTPIAAIAYAPPTPPSIAAIGPRFAQARAPGARAPPVSFHA